MWRCCPQTCGVSHFTEDDCLADTSEGDCIYPNEAQCFDKGLFLLLRVCKIIIINRKLQYTILIMSRI